MNLWQIAFTGHAHPKCAQCKTVYPGAVCVLFVSNLNSPSQQQLPPVVSPIQATAKKSAATSMEVAILRRRAASPTPAVSVASTTHASGATSSSAEPIGHPAAPSRMATESLDSVRSFFPIHSADTPLLADHFARLLRNHSDQSCVAYVIHGLRHGFPLGPAGQHDISVFSNNLPSAFTHSAFISELLAASCTRSETTGPFSSPPFQFMRRSGIGTVPKKNGKLRMIHHLSSPEGTGANDSIPAKPLSLHYVSIDNAINIIMSCPQPAYLSKLHVRSTFRQIPVHRQNFAGKAPTTTSAFCLSAFAPAQPSLTQ